MRFDTEESDAIAMLLQTIERIRTGQTVGLSVVETSRDRVVSMRQLIVPQEADFQPSNPLPPSSSAV